MNTPSESINQPHQGNESAASVSPQSMSSIVYDKYGDTGVFRLAKIPLPRRRSGDVLINVEASSVNAIDKQLRRGEMRSLFSAGFPRVPGCDVAGRVVACDPECEFQPGDRVIALLNPLQGGACAEFTVCSAKATAKIPDSLSIEEAAAIPLAGTTALQSLRDYGKLAPGKRVLIDGASGGVGAFAIQIAKAYGCHVTAVASGKKESFCLEMGADQFCDYEKQKFTWLGEHWDLIFDLALNSCYLDTLDVLNVNGRYVSTEPHATGILTTLVSLPMSKSGSTMVAKPSASDLRELIALYQDGKLKIAIDAKFPFSQIADAHSHLKKGGVRGKVVLVNDLGMGENLELA